MRLAIPALILLPSCNLALWAAVSAGIAKTRSRRFVWLAVHGITFCAALGASIFAAFGSTDPSASRLTVIAFWLAWLVVGFGSAVVLAYVVYSVRGRRSAFGSDLRGSMWLSRSGFSPLGGGRARAR